MTARLGRAAARAQRTRFAGYVFAVVIIAAVTFLKIRFVWIGRDLPVASYLGAVMISAWFGGTGPGLLATALATLGGAFFFAEPYDSIAVASSQDAVALAVGAVEGAFISLAAGALRRARVDTEKRADELARVNLELRHEVEARCRAEGALRSTTEQLFHAQRMESVGRIAGGVAHDFNNMLSIVLSYADILLRRLGSEDKTREEVEQLRAAGRRAADLAGQLLAFSRREAPRVERVDVDEVVRGVEPMLRRLVGGDVALVLRTTDGLWKVEADPSQIEQVVVNLAANARDAMVDGGELTLRTENAIVDADEAKQLAVEPGPYVLLAVRDTGKGMDEATAARALEPYFTTKQRGKGTGLGLAVVAAIAQQARGGARLVSEAGAGTEARVYFPRARAE